MAVNKTITGRQLLPDKRLLEYGERDPSSQQRYERVVPYEKIKTYYPTGVPGIDLPDLYNAPVSSPVATSPVNLQDIQNRISGIASQIPPLSQQVSQMTQKPATPVAKNYLNIVAQGRSLKDIIDIDDLITSRINPSTGMPEQGEFPTALLQEYARNAGVSTDVILDLWKQQKGKGMIPPYGTTDTGLQRWADENPEAFDNWADLQGWTGSTQNREISGQDILSQLLERLGQGQDTSTDYRNQLAEAIKSLTGAYTGYSTALQNQSSASAQYQQFREQLGIPAKEQQLTGIQGQVQKTEQMLNDLEASLNERVSGTLTPEGVRQRMLAVERRPLAKQYSELLRGQGYAEQGMTSARQQLSDLISMSEKNYERQLKLAQLPIEQQKSLIPLYQELVKQQIVPQKYEEVSPGATLFDPKTGKEIYRAPGAEKAQSETEKTRALKTAAIAKAKDYFDKFRAQKAGDPNWDGYIYDTDYMKLRSDFAEAIGDASLFDEVFAPLLSPVNRSKLGVGKVVGVKAGGEAGGTGSETKLDQLLNNL